MYERVIISGLKLPMHIGCEPAERKLAQILQLNLEIGIQKNATPRTENLDDTVCYLMVCQDLKSLVAEKEWPLLEQFADEIIGHIFKKFKMASEIKIQIRKFVIPNTDWVGIEMVKKRDI